MIALLALLTHDAGWVTPVAVFDTKAECFSALPALALRYHKKFPEALLWCSEPIGYTGD